MFAVNKKGVSLTSACRILCKDLRQDAGNIGLEQLETDVIFYWKYD